VSQRVATGSRPLANGISGVSTRRVDELVQAMGLNGISKSTVSKLCKE
jgi:transposase-like protein